jgi:hypothetical protein
VRVKIKVRVDGKDTGRKGERGGGVMIGFGTLSLSLSLPQ